MPLGAADPGLDPEADGQALRAASDIIGLALGMIGGAGAVLALGYWLFSSP